MPINISDSPLSSIKIGENNILKGYVGEGQIFPNNTEITGAAFTNSNVANTGGNEPYVVSGDIGSSFTLTGSSGATGPVGTQVLSTSPTTYQIAIDDQSTTCAAPIRNPQILIAPQGNTVLAGALSSTDTIIQAAGPVNQTNNPSLAFSSITNLTRNTITVGSQIYWNTGSEWQIAMTWYGGSLGSTFYKDLRVSSSAVSPLTPIWDFQYLNPVPVTSTLSGDYNTAYTLTWLGTPVPPIGPIITVRAVLTVNGNVGAATVQFTAGVTDVGCVTGGTTTIDSGLIYP